MEQEFLPLAFQFVFLAGRTERIGSPLACIPEFLSRVMVYEGFAGGRSLPPLDQALWFEDRRGMILDSYAIQGRRLRERRRETHHDGDGWYDWEDTRSESVTVAEGGELVHEVKLTSWDMRQHDSFRLYADGSARQSKRVQDATFSSWPPQVVDLSAKPAREWSGDWRGKPLLVSHDGEGGARLSRAIRSGLHGSFDEVESGGLREPGPLRLLEGGEERAQLTVTESGDVSDCHSCYPASDFSEIGRIDRSSDGLLETAQFVWQQSGMRGQRDARWVGDVLAYFRFSGDAETLNFELNLIGRGSNGAPRRGDGFSFVEYRVRDAVGSFRLLCVSQGLGSDEGGELGEFMTLRAGDAAGQVFWTGELWRELHPATR